MTAEFVERCGAGKRLGCVYHGAFPEFLREHGDAPGLKVVKCHWLDAQIAERFERDEALGIYIFRDVRAAIVSSMRMKRSRGSKKTFDVRILKFVSRYLTRHEQWTQLGENVQSSRYED